MPLGPGTRLGPYQILSLLGSGGMGEVYQAIDVRLDRLVALKVLPEAAGTTGPEVIRFQREARAASALNHPNICTIYDVGDGDRPYLAMELLEGQTLEQRLAHGPLDVSEICDIGLQLADALDAAHARGIIHRDIKPGNLFLSARGPKILDFGLAKTVGRPAADDQVTMPAEARLTGEGSTLGTIAYMSPEQLRGETLDARTDLFSLGVVLYEMATGRAAFTGSTTAVISGGILHRHPEAPRDIRPELPVPLSDLILRLLEKERDLRIQSAADVRAELKRLKRDSASSHGDAVPARAVSRPSPEHTGATSTSDIHVIASLVKRNRMTTLALALGSLGLLIGAVTLTKRLGSSADHRNPFDHLRIVPLTSDGTAEKPALSPDGKYIAYLERSADGVSLWVRQIETAANVCIVKAEAGAAIRGATVSPDGAFVDFIRRSGGVPAMWRVPFLGGTPKKIIDDVTSPIGWSTDGQRMAFLQDAGQEAVALVVADVGGEHRRRVAVRRSPDQFTTIRHQIDTNRPAWSPNDRRIAAAGFEFHDGGSKPVVAIIGVDDGSTRTIPARSAVAGVAWLDAESLLINERDRPGEPLQLWRVGIGGETLGRVSNDLNEYVGLTVDPTRTRAAVMKSEDHTGIWLANAAGDELRQVAPDTVAGDVDDVAWGEHLIFTSTLRGRLAIRSLSQDSASPTELIADARAPALTSDGRTIVFVSGTAGTNAGPLWRANIDGGSRLQLAPSALFPMIVNDRDVVFLSNQSGKQSLWRVPIDAGGAAVRLTRRVAGRAAVSRDGKSLAYVTIDDYGKPAIAVCPIAGCEEERLFPARVSIVRWTPDNQGIAYINPTDRTNLWVQPVDGGPPFQKTHWAGGLAIDDFAWSPDGKQLGIVRSHEATDIVMFDGLKARN
jgi:serine/threonine protein kinase/Tol biopolymer transport system component